MTLSETPLIRVAATSSPFKVAGAIANMLREHSRVQVQAIGAGALNPSLKALIYARGYIAQDHLDLTIVPEMVNIPMQDHERTAMRFIVTACSATTTESGN